jgi:hypothetical protein
MVNLSPIVNVNPTITNNPSINVNPTITVSPAFTPVQQNIAAPAHVILDMNSYTPQVVMKDGIAFKVKNILILA